MDICDGKANMSADLESVFHRTIKKVTEDIEALKFNTAIATMMAALNDIYAKGSITKEELRIFIILANPFAPHVTEEMNSLMGNKKMVTVQAWPVYDPAKCVDATVEIAVQVNGKIKARINIANDATKETVAEQANKELEVAEAVEGKTIVKEIYVPGKLYNIVVK